MSNSAELVHLIRGPMVESIHTGDVAVVNAKGELLAFAGAPKEKMAFWRSSAKPFQAIPVVESGAIDHFGLAENELAQMCASHAGEDIHINTVRAILAKLGLDESYLQCGVHYPSHGATHRRMIAAGEKATEIHCNCSGKHSGMLAQGKMYGEDLSNYTDLQHPVQQRDLASVSAFTGVSIEDIVIGIDGCGVPVHGISVYAMALAWARLVDPIDMPQQRVEAARRVRTAMMHNPYLIAGEGRTCTRLMQALPERIVAKSGADAVYCFALPEKGIGVALKIADGGGRAVAPAVISTLHQLGYFSEEELKPLENLATATLTNHHSDVVGRIVPVFDLQWAKGANERS